MKRQIRINETAKAMKLTEVTSDYVSPVSSVSMPSSFSLLDSDLPMNIEFTKSIVPLICSSINSFGIGEKLTMSLKLSLTCVTVIGVYTEVITMNKLISCS